MISVKSSLSNHLVLCIASKLRHLDRVWDLLPDRQQALNIEEAFVATKSDPKDPKMPLTPVPSIRTIEGWKTLGLRYNPRHALNVFEPDFLRDISEVAVHLGGEDGANATGTQREMSVFTMQVM